MNKCVCDICRVNEASEKFKVKKRMKVNHELNTFGYRKIDICESCYRGLFGKCLKHEVTGDIETRLEPCELIVDGIPYKVRLSGISNHNIITSGGVIEKKVFELMED